MELRKHGHRIRLQDQPLLVLVALLEHPGEIVTREQLQERIWAKDTFVDFDQSLNKAVNRLRETLNDDAGRPRYIETVPRRGYRFVAPVTGIAPPVAVPEAQQNPRWRWAAAGILFVLAVSAALWEWKPWHRGGAARRAPIRLTTHGLPMDAKISRDGKLLAYSSSAVGEVVHIWVQQIPGGEPIQVTNGPDEDRAPDFSPDGTHVVFHSERNGGGIFIVPTFGGEPRRLIKGAVSVPVLSPDGTEVLYHSGGFSFHEGLWVVSTDGGEPLQLLGPQYDLKSTGLWSPDGTTILLEATDRENPADHGKWLLVPARGGTPVPFPFPADTYKDVQSPSFTSWRRMGDGRQWLVFVHRKKDTSNLFRIAIDPGGRPVGNVEQITSGTAFTSGADLSEEGSLVFVSGTYAGQIQMVPADTNQAKTQGQPRQITYSEGVLNYSPAVSRDGRWLAYSSIKPIDGNASIRLRDLRTGAERELIGGDGYKGNVSISPDGSQVAYDAFVNDKRSTFVVPAAGGTPARICDRCDARGFSSDGSILLAQRVDAKSGLARAIAVQVPGGNTEGFLAHPTQDLWHPFFAWDDRWVTFKKVLHGSFAKIMIAPVRNGVAGAEREWISVTDGQYCDGKPQFSPDGNTLYFNSTRDRHLCIWARRLDPVTKRPVGEPFVVQHFHELQPWVTSGPQWSVIELWVAKDKLVTNFLEAHGGLWMTKLD